MKNQFAKSFDLEDHQVLVTKEYDAEDEHHKIVITTDLGSVRMSVSGGYKSESDRDEHFDSYTEEDANRFLESMQKTIRPKACECTSPIPDAQDVDMCGHCGENLD